MKSIFYSILLILLVACQSKPNPDDLQHLNGYWEIEHVSFPDGTKKEYQVNEWIDKIQLKENKGWRQKVQPQVNGSFIKNDIKEIIQVLDSNDCYYLKTKATYTVWTDKLISVSKDTYIVENDSKIQYKYKRFVPYENRN